MKRIFGITVAILYLLLSSNTYSSTTEQNRCFETINDSNTPSEQVWKLKSQIDFHGSLSVGTIFYDRTENAYLADDTPGCSLHHNGTRNERLKAGSNLQVSIKYRPRKEEFWCKAKNAKEMTEEELTKFCRNFVEEYKADEFLENYQFKKITKDDGNEDSFKLTYEGAKHVYVEIKNVKGVFGFSCRDILKTFDELKSALPVTGFKCP